MPSKRRKEKKQEYKIKAVWSKLWLKQDLLMITEEDEVN